MSDPGKMKELRTVAPDEDFNSEFAHWMSAKLPTPRDGEYICRNWFTTALRRGRQVDYAFEPLNANRGAGLRLLMRDPPEMVRLWHKLPLQVRSAPKALFRLGLRGDTAARVAPEVTVALFRGRESERTFVRRLFGPVPLQEARREVDAEVIWEDGELHDDSLVSLKFAGAGVFEVDFCRLEPLSARTRPWIATRAFANRVLRRATGRQPGQTAVGLPAAMTLPVPVSTKRVVGDVRDENERPRSADLEELRDAIQTMAKTLELSDKQMDR
jgi:hypothetical protein